MIYFAPAYLIGCLLALAIGNYAITKFDNYETPVFDSFDEEIRTSIWRMTMFLIIVSSWIIVTIFLLYKIFNIINKNLTLPKRY